MRAVVGYESMFGNTRLIAEAIAAGLAQTYEVTTVPAARLEHELQAGADLLVLGGPTHGWNMSRPSTRATARKQAGESKGTLFLEPGAEGPGLREWFAATHAEPTAAAAFATRVNAPWIISGSAAPRIAKQLRRRGWRLVARPASFRVSGYDTITDGELDRAREWGYGLAAAAQREQAAR